MSSAVLGENISSVEVTHISRHGIWLLSHDQELFLSYEDFPWFKNARLDEVLNVHEPQPGHFHWPDLDVDLGIESIKRPEHFPLQAVIK